MPVLKLSIPNHHNASQAMSIRSISTAAQAIHEFANRFGVAVCAVDWSVAMPRSERVA